MTRTRSSEKSDLKCQIFGKSWKKVYRAHAPYGVNKAHMQDEWHVQHTWHMWDTGHTNELGRHYHKGYVQKQRHM